MLQIDKKSTGPHQVQMESWVALAPFEKLLNIEIVEVKEGCSVLKAPFLIEYAQGAGFMHGGALVTLADTAVMVAIKNILPPLTLFATISLESRFLCPVTRGVVTARAEVKGREGNLIKGEATIYDETGKPVMDFISVFKVSNRKSRLEG